MGSQWGYDRTYIRARHEGYRSRAAYKLLEIQKKFSVIRPDDTIVDLGAAPGSWLQVERSLTNAGVIGIDLNPISPLEGVETIVADLNDPGLPAQVLSILGHVSVVLSDAAPKLSGQKSYDQARVMALNEDALVFAAAVLREGGNFVVKSFQGTDFPDLIMRAREHFRSVRTFNTPSTRKGSTEVYIIAKNFAG